VNVHAIAATAPRPPCLAFRLAGQQNGSVFKPGQLVRVNLAGMQVQGVLFHAAVTDAVGNIVKQTSEDPPKYLVRLLFSFKGVNEVEVPADRIRAG
jgi:hypothetical protein